MADSLICSEHAQRLAALDQKTSELKEDIGAVKTAVDYIGRDIKDGFSQLSERFNQLEAGLSLTRNEVGEHRHTLKSIVSYNKKQKKIFWGALGTVMTTLFGLLISKIIG
jgi:hypothetical protein